MKPVIKPNALIFFEDAAEIVDDVFAIFRLNAGLAFDFAVEADLPRPVFSSPFCVVGMEEELP